jgi:hypothetical protein
MVAEATELATLESNISYANTRWGITHFYIDTFAYWNGSTPVTIDSATVSSLLTYCQSLSIGCFLDPEAAASNSVYQYAVPYTDSNAHPEGTPPSVRTAYPWARSILNLSNEFTSTCGPGTINNYGTVNTSGTSVTWVSGVKFNSGEVGQPIIIPYPGGTSYTVASYTNNTSITLTTSAGTKTGVGYGAGTLGLGYNWGTWLANIGAPSAGDIPMFSGWYGSTENNCAARLYIMGRWF